MKRFDSTVTELQPVASDYFRITFQWPVTLPLPQPGCFLTVSAGSGFDPALRRPFAFSDVDPARGTAAFIFQRRGRGTAWLAERRPGDSLDVLGPLGAGFRAPPSGARPVLVAGGIGLGPMLFLARQLHQTAAAGRNEVPILVLGYRSASQAPSVDLPPGSVICTDDGMRGFHGSAVAYLDQLADALPPYYYACGPVAMMAAIDRLAPARAGQADLQAATEQWMACGVGACQGCVIPFKDGGFKRCCADGPVFNGRMVDWVGLQE